MKNEFLVGDNLHILSELPANFCDLVYMDPPYNTGRNFGEFDDKFDSMKDYAEGFLAPRFAAIKRILTKEGNIVVHVEPKNSHYVRLALDECFGEKNFRNEIAWKSGGNAKNLKQLGRHHDVLLVYSKSKTPIFNAQYKPYDDEYKKRSSAKQMPQEISTFDLDSSASSSSQSERFNKPTPHAGRWYVTTALHNAQPDVNPRPNLRYEWNGHFKQWYCTQERMKNLHKQDRLNYNRPGVPRIIRFLDEMDGIPIKDLWTDINQIQSPEKLNYPTQKPVGLLKRVISLYSDPGSMVVDPYAGSGTTARAARDLGRSYLMIDVNPNAKNVFHQSITEER